MPSAEERLEEKVDQLGTAFEAFKKSNDERLKELSTKKSVDPLLAEKVEKANSDIDKIMEAKSALEKEIKEVKTALNRGGKDPNPEDEAKKAQLEKNAFLDFVRRGDERMTPDEKKGLSVSNDTAGGYLVEATLEAGILRDMANVNVVRNLATVRTISRSDAYERNRRKTGVTGTWAGEGDQNPDEQNPTLGKLRIPAEEMRVKLYESAQILEDAASDVESWLNEEAAEAFGNLEGAAFVNGNGVAKPRGILTYPAGAGAGQIEQIKSGSAATIADAQGQADGLIDMLYSLKAAYAKNGQILLNRKTVGSIRKLKDENGQYIWAPGIGGTPASIMSYSYFEDDNMPVEGAGNLVMIFADFKKLYKIIDRLGMSVIRDPFSSKPDVEFLFRRRVGGAVELFEAGKILKCAA